MESASPLDPPLVYVFVSRASPAAVINYELTGTFMSPVYAALEQDPSFREQYVSGTADFLPYAPNPQLSTGFLSPFTAGALSAYAVEYDAELARRAHFPQLPSRLTAVFALETREACEEVHRRYGWDLGEVVPFRVVHALRVCRVNMEIVSLARDAYRTSMLAAEERDRLWRSYWSGADRYAMDLPTIDARGRRLREAGALWEVLLDGKLVRADRWTPVDAPPPAQP